MKNLPRNLQELRSLLKDKQSNSSSLQFSKDLVAEEREGKLLFLLSSNELTDEKGRESLEKFFLQRPKDYVDFLINKNCFKDAGEFIEKEGFGDGKNWQLGNDEDQGQVQEQLQQNLAKKVFNTIKTALRDDKKIPGVETKGGSFEVTVVKDRFTKKTTNINENNAAKMLLELQGKYKQVYENIIKYAEDIGKEEDLVDKMAVIVASRLDKQLLNQKSIVPLQFTRLGADGKEKKCEITGNKEVITIDFGDKLTSSVSVKDLAGKYPQEQFKLIKEAIKERIEKTPNGFLSLTKDAEDKIEGDYQKLEPEDRAQYKESKSVENMQRGFSSPYNQRGLNQDFGVYSDKLRLGKPGINYEKALWNVAGVAMFVAAIAIFATGGGIIVAPLLFCGAVAFIKAYVAHNEQLEVLKEENSIRRIEHDARQKQQELQKAQESKANVNNVNIDEVLSDKQKNKVDETVATIKGNQGNANPSEDASANLEVRQFQSNAKGNISGRGQGNG
jgi:hypothetical protein